MEIRNASATSYPRLQAWQSWYKVNGSLRNQDARKCSQDKPKVNLATGNDRLSKPESGRSKSSLKVNVAEFEANYFMGGIEKERQTVGKKTSSMSRRK